MKLRRILALLLALVLTAALPCGVFAATTDPLAQIRTDAKAAVAQIKTDILTMLNMYVNDGAMTADQGTACQNELTTLETSIGSAIDAAADQSTIEGQVDKFAVLANLKLDLALRQAGFGNMENLEQAEKQQAMAEACKWVEDAIAAIEQAAVPSGLSVPAMQLMAAIAQSQMHVNGHKFDYYFDIARNVSSLDSSIVAAAQQEMVNVTNAAIAAIGNCSTEQAIYLPQETGMVNIDLTWWKVNEKERLMWESHCNELTDAMDGYVVDGLLTQQDADAYKTAMTTARGAAFAAMDAVTLNLSAITGCTACQNGAFDCKQFPAGDCQNYSTQCDCHTVWDACREAEEDVNTACEAGIAAIKAVLPKPTEDDRAAAIAAVTAELDSVVALMRSCTNVYDPEDIEASVTQFKADFQYILDALDELDLNDITTFALQQAVNDVKLEMALCRAELTVYDAFIGSINAAADEIMALDGELTDEQKESYLQQMEQLIAALDDAIVDAPTPEDIYAAGEEAQAILDDLLAQAREDNEKFKTVNEELNDVPAEIAGQYTSVEEIESAMVSTALANVAGLESDKVETILMDVTLQVNNGGVWEAVDPENFPAEGVTVLLPYPENTTADSHNFVIAHMITHGAAAGTVELLPGTPTAEDIQVTFTSLSPVAVLYQEKSVVPTPPQQNDPPVTPQAPVTPAQPAAPVISIPDTADESNVSLWVCLLLFSTVAMAGAVLYGKKQRN